MAITSPITLFMCSSAYECYYGLEITFIVNLHHVTLYLFAVTHKYILNCNIMDLRHLLVINGYYLTDTFPKTIYSCSGPFMSVIMD